MRKTTVLKYLLFQIRDKSITSLVSLKEKLEKSIGMKVPNIGIGSTPSCSHESSSMGVLTEIHPGAYVFYDSQQMKVIYCLYPWKILRCVPRKR